ncbi:MAG: YhcH/YjgK/YiaL family protein [Clostridium sp.]|uniref:YhcH/YjgK/YiaL family protein n=1 Tax=Clostridium sp. TaxID=1506 RepID=UPI0030325DB2
MIIDKLENSQVYYGLGNKIKAAFKYLNDTNFEEMECGTYYINDKFLYASVAEYETKNKEESLWEAHRKYIDIQFVIRGEEQMGYTNVDNINETVNYNEDKDILFGTGEGDFITVKSGEFIMFMPQDAHMPCIYSNEKSLVKKVVIKIKID